MTVLTDRRANWDNILTSSRRFDKEGEWMTSLQIVDTFEGEVHDPQSLHKYLYCHADPINMIDPTGQYAVLGLLSKLLYYTSSPWGDFNPASGMTDFAHEILKLSSTGEGGYNIDTALQDLQKDVTAKWNKLGTKKAQLLDSLHSLSLSAIGKWG